jgi:hypothetical protein
VRDINASQTKKKRKKAMMNHHPHRAVPVTTVVTSETQLKWALVTSRQRAQAARERIRQLYGDHGRNNEENNENSTDEQRTTTMNRGSNRLDDSQSEYSERKQWIEQHGYRHECSVFQGGDYDDDDDNEERSRRRRRMNESWCGRRFVIKQQLARWNDASFPSPAAWGRGGRVGRRDAEPDDPGRVERFQMAFAAAVAAIEKNQDVHPFPPSRFDSTSTTSFSKSTLLADETPHRSHHLPKSPHYDGTPKTKNSIVWTPQLREQVTSAAKSVLRPPHTKNRQQDDDDGNDDNDHDDDDDEVDFFVRQFERFMLQPDDSLTSHESCLVEEVPPSSTNGWNNASSIVHEDETSTWTVDDSMSTIPPPEDEIVESTIQEEIYFSGKKVPDNNTVIDIPNRVLSSESSTPPPPPLAKERPQNHVAVPTAAPPNRLVPALPDDKIPFDWSCSSIKPKPLAPPSRIIATTTAMTTAVSSSLSSSAGCGLSVVRGAHVPYNNVVSSHYHCSAHWERQMML